MIKLDIVLLVILIILAFLGLTKFIYDLGWDKGYEQGVKENKNE